MTGEEKEFPAESKQAFLVLWRCVGALCSAFLLAAAFPPIEGAEAAWVAMVPLLLLARFSSPLESFRMGFLGGLVFWLISLSWVLRLSQTWGPWPVVALGWVLLACYCALYMGAFLMTVSAILAHSARRRTREKPGADACNGLVAWHNPRIAENLVFLAVVPLLWVGFEYLRSSLFTGFPWNTLGVSQYRNLAVIQVAEWGGVYAVSAVVMTMNAALMLTALRLAAVYRGRRPARLHVELMIGLLVCLLCWMHGVRTVGVMRAEPCGEFVEIRVAAIQPNIPQLQKWPAEFASAIYERLELGTELALFGVPDLIVWPETSVPRCVKTDPQASDFVAAVSRDGAQLLVGSVEIEMQADKDRYYNSSFLFVDGKIVQEYRKRHLVPFGEYLPFDKILGFVERLAPVGFSCTPGATSTVFRLRGPRAAFSALICFEDIMAPLAREFVLGGARFLVNQTNDAWFDGSSAAVQHMSHCVFRCVENRVPAVRCANTGVTCFIDKTGLLDSTSREVLKRGETRLVNHRTERMIVRDDMPLTFYTRYGDIPFALPCAIMASVFLVLVVAGERRESLRPKV